MKKTVYVAAAVLLEGGRVLATQRGYGPQKDGWEFPGGKVEAGESPREALVREIREELAAEIALEDHLGTVAYDYPDFHLEMDCYLARFVGPGMVLREHEAARWLTPETLDTVAWLPPDRAILPQVRAAMTRRAWLEAQAAIPPGRYRHFKGREYEVLGVARHSETEAPLVVYRPLYGEGGLWVRPAEMWNETLEREGKTFRRFTPIPDPAEDEETGPA